jgi:hypothetical protein
MHRLAIYPIGLVITGYVNKNTASGNMLMNTAKDMETSRRLLGNDSADRENAAGPGGNKPSESDSPSEENTTNLK